MIGERELTIAPAVAAEIEEFERRARAFANLEEDE